MEELADFADCWLLMLVVDVVVVVVGGGWGCCWGCIEGVDREGEVAEHGDDRVAGTNNSCETADSSSATLPVGLPLYRSAGRSAGGEPGDTDDACRSAAGAGADGGEG